MEDAGVSLPVIEARCQYHRPARYDDEIEVTDGGTDDVASADGVRSTTVVRKSDQVGRGHRAARCTRRSTAAASRAACRRGCARLFA